MSAPLYRPRSRSRIWLAIIVSTLLHGAAIALAGLHRPPSGLELSGPLDDDSIVVTYEPDPISPPPLLEAADSPPLLPPDQPIFQDEIPATPPPQRRSAVTRPIRKTAAARTSSRSNSASAKVLALSAPRPEYPFEARRGRITGEGIASLTIDSATGRVLTVLMTESTGSAILDQAAIAGFRRWRFRHGTAAIVRCPITYTLTGAILQ